MRRQARGRVHLYETLEARQVLATGMFPEIFGTIYDDRNANLAPDPDEALSDVLVRLHVDDGDGFFDPTQDALVAETRSDATGLYCFSDLDVDLGYFVHRPAVTVAGKPFPSVVSPLIRPGRPGTVIDEFQTRQIASAIPPAPSVNGSTLLRVDQSEMIGGERDLAVELVEGIGAIQLRVNPFGLEELLEFNDSPGTVGTRRVIWDGVDNDAFKLSFGLNGRDLTNQGRNQGIMMRAGVDASGAGTQVQVLLYQDNAETFSSASAVIPVTGGDASGSIYLPFTEFVGAVSPTSVDAIELRIVGGTRASDGKIALVGAIGPKRFDVSQLIVADLAVTKTNGVATVIPGQSLQYQIVATNLGPNPVTGARIRDVLPPELQGVVYTSTVTGMASGNTPQGQGAIDDVVTLAPGSTITYVLEGRVSDDVSGTIENYVEIVPPASVYDPAPVNNSARDRDEVGLGVDLTVSKDDGVRVVRAGDELTYRIIARNHGPGPVDGARVTDLFPDTLLNVSYISEASEGVTGNTLSGTGDIDDLLSLPEGGAVTYLVSAVVSDRAIGTLVNRVMIEPPSNRVELTPENNIEIDTNLVEREIADVAITKTNGVDTVVAGQTTTYTVVVTNHGPSNAARISVVDQFPSMLENVRYTSTAIGSVTGNTPSGNGEIDDVLYLAPGATVIYTATGTVSADASGVLQNTATVSVPFFDPNLDNNQSTDVDSIVTTADLSVSKTDNRNEIRPGDPTRYTIEVRNLGPASIKGARVVDLFPDSLTDVRYERHFNGQVSTGTGNIDELIDLPSGAAAVYFVDATVAVDATAAVVNVVNVEPPNGIVDPNPQNNRATDINAIGRSQVDVAVRKLSAQSVAVPGERVTYTLLVANVGQTAVAQAVVTDEPPLALDDVTYTSEVFGNVAGNTPSGSGTINDTLQLAVGASVIYTLEGTVRANAQGTLRNVAEVELIGQTDTNPGNNLDIDLLNVVAHANLSITKTDGRDRIDAGETTTYSLVVRNDGPSDVAGVRVEDLVPPGLSDVTYTSQGTAGVSGNTVAGTGDISDLVYLPVDATLTYLITGTAANNVSGVIVNRGSVRGPLSSQFVELDPSDNVAIDRNQIGSVISLGSEPTVILNDQTLEAGTVDRFRITAHSTGKTIFDLQFDHQQSDLQLAIDDADGNQIAIANSTNDGERLIIPVVSQQTYFVRVFGANEEVTGRYALEIENFAPSNAEVLRMLPESDTGMMNDDAVTADPQPIFLIHADLEDFTQMGIPVLEPDVETGQLPVAAGVAVEVRVQNVATGETTVGFASQTAPGSGTFTYRAPTGHVVSFLESGQYTIASAIRVFDLAQTEGAPDPATGRVAYSRPFFFTIDLEPPVSADRPDLIASSDSGTSYVDDVTAAFYPVLTGTGEPNAKVRVMANQVGKQAEIAGQGVVNSDGRWQVTVGPLTDGVYHFRAEFEDAAGNPSNVGEPLLAEIDTIAPNLPYLDLVASHDTGFSVDDNVTGRSELKFSMTTEDPGHPKHLSPFNFKYRLFVRPAGSDNPATGEEQLIYDSSLDPDIPLANIQDGLTDLRLLVKTVGPFPDGLHNFKLEVEDRAGNISHDFLLNVLIDTQAPPAELELLPSSDSGTFNDDRVTNKMQPAVSGVSEVGASVIVLANGRQVGEGRVGSDDSDGVPGNGLGTWEVTVEPLIDGTYEMIAVTEDLAGNVSTSTAIQLMIDGRQPNVPYLQLLTDTGISDVDRVTKQNAPFVSITANATVEGGANPPPNDIRFRVYDRPGDQNGEVLLIDSFGALRDLTSDGFFIEQLPELSDGIHNLKVEIEDRAGNISHAFLESILIDTEPPTALPPFWLESSDSGMLSDDRVTRINSPSLGGYASVGETVSLYANGTLVGQTQVGSDETDGNPADGLGAWRITTEPLDDGVYEFVTTVEDLAGNRVAFESETVVIDTIDPNVPLLRLLSSSGKPTDQPISSDASPQVSVTANDTADGGDNPFPHDIKFRIYDRSGDAAETLLFDSFAEFSGFSSEGHFVVTLPELSDGLHNLKLEVEDRAGNISHAFLLELWIDTDGPVAGDFDLARYSDTGMSDSDRVTSIRQPAIIGTGTVGDTVYLTMNGELAGTTTVGGDESDGIPDNGLGAWEITSEPLDDGVYRVGAELHDVAGNVAVFEAFTIEIDTLEPNLPFLDLLEPDDTGRHNDDNITSVEAARFTATTSDLNAAAHRELFPGGQNFKYRIYLRPESGEERLVYDSATDPSLVGRIDGLTARTLIQTPPLALPEGLHDLKLEVEDRAGNISHDERLSLLVDRTDPSGEAFLHPDSDTGVPGRPESFQDGVTSDRTPRFAGTAEANSLVMITIDGLPAATTVATPLDGDDAVSPPDPPYAIRGNWAVDSTRALSGDGTYDVVVTYEDPAGNRSTSSFQLVLDTRGPGIINVTPDLPGFPSLFEPKPSSGPDPLIDRIVIHVVDDQPGDGNSLPAVDPSIASEEGHYRLVGDANGPMPITDVEIEEAVGSDGQAVSRIILKFTEPLPDDRYTLTVSDRLTDLSGNRLDGESGASAPFEGNPGTRPVQPIFPTGDGVSGGDFVARFTVDSRPELGTWAAGSVWIDTNGNFEFDPRNHDYVNRDIVYKYGFTADDVFAGNFALHPTDTTDGFDKLAAYGRAEGTFRWLVDTDNDGVPNIDRVDPHQANGVPVAGRFDGSDTNGDEVGLFDGTTWYFDTNHDFLTDRTLRTGMKGYPIVGDFDGDGFDDLATWADNQFRIDLARGRRGGWDGVADRTVQFGFIGVRERPIAADMDQDGFDDFGLWVPDREGVTERDASEWYILISAGKSLLERLSPQDDPINASPTIDFRPWPFGDDLYGQFGDEFALPIVGNFDPPTQGLTSTNEKYQNLVQPLDVNGDGHISPVDALLVINELNQRGAQKLTGRDKNQPLIDVNGDGFASPLDALLIVNELNRVSRVRPAVAAVPEQPLFDDEVFRDLAAIDEFWQDFGDDSDQIRKSKSR